MTLTPYYDHDGAADFDAQVELDTECHHCGGSGEVTTEQYESYFCQMYKTCPMCGGTGEQ